MDTQAMATDRAATAADLVVDQVRRLYERYPYPNYPLLAKPRWREGYLSHSRFAARLALDLVATQHARGSASHSPMRHVVIGGAGDMLPYVIHAWESLRPGPSAHLTCVDLSARSLQRAKLRIASRWRLPGGARVQFKTAELVAFLAAAGEASIDHLDLYGVLHHLPSPRAALAAAAHALRPGGTMRLMVYNSTARNWIHHLARALQMLGLSAEREPDLAAARALVKVAAQHLPAIGERLAQMGSATLANPSRFADTFLHPRAARLDIEAWFSAFSAAGLQPVGLFDRYGELDDLPNPLWRPPTAQQLAARAADGRFENNLEMYLVKPSASPARAGAAGPPTAAASRWQGLPPQAFRQYAETQDLPVPVLMRLWQAHTAWVLGGHLRPLDDLLRSLPMPAAQRLTRMGAILPGQIVDPGRRRALAEPLEDSVSPPLRPAGLAIAAMAPELKALVRQLQHRSPSGASPTREALILERLRRAQY